MRGRRPAILLLAAFAIVSVAGPGFAKGKPSSPPGQSKKLPTPPAPGPGGAPRGAAPGMRALGVWLDDASVLDPSTVWVGLSVSRWLSPAATGTDAPVMDIAAGLTPRVQVAATVPYFSAADTQGGAIHGLGDTYVGAKVVLREPSTRHFGVAITPTMEILSGASVESTPGARRVNWVLPASIEVRRGEMRIYGTGGYFTRGAIFGSGAVEKALTARLTVTGSLTHCYATDGNALSEEFGLSRHRTDASGAVSYAVSPALMVFGSVGRTLSQLDYDGSQLAINAGVTFNVLPPRTRVGR